MTLAASEQDLLLAACRARPADDLPRLVLADWLEEQGEHDRAQFIRIQLDLSHPSGCMDRTRALKKQEQSLLAEQAAAWLGPLPQIICDVESVTSSAAERVKYYCFERGLIRILSCRKDLHLASGFREWLRTPLAHWLEAYQLPTTTIDHFVKASFPDELHGRLDGTLKMRTDASPQQVIQQIRQLVVSSNFAALRKLQLPDGLSTQALRELVLGPLSHMVDMQIPSCEDVEAASALMATAELTSLASLSLGGLTTTAIKHLVRSPHLGQLVELHLIGCPIGDAGVIALCASPLAQTLRVVEFPNTNLGDAGVLAITRSPLLKHLHGPKFNLMMNRIGDPGLQALAECESLLRFGELVLRENHIQDAGVEALAASPFAANLRYLDFWRNQLTDRAAYALASSPYLNAIHDLNVRENPISDGGAAALQERFGTCVKL